MNDIFHRNIAGNATYSFLKAQVVLSKIQMDILGLSTSPSSGGAYALILNETDGKRRLPIIIGTFEAQAIALELENIKPPRPMTHDLLKSAIEQFNAKVSKITINDVKEGTFYASIEIETKDGKKITIDSRPSDAIALAVRTGTPIFVAEVVMMQAKLVNAEKDAEETKKFKEFISNMKPEDFTKYYKKD